MDRENRQRLAAIWRQGAIPVLFRQSSGPLLVKFERFLGDRSWLRRDRQRIPRRNEKFFCWSTPRSWLDGLVDQFLERDGMVYIIQPLKRQQKCAPACVNALHHDCECSCMGENHGSGHLGRSWKVISEVFATKWSEEELACRLIKRER